MTKSSVDQLNSKHIKDFQNKKRFKKMLKSNEFKCYNKGWLDKSLHLNKYKTYEEIDKMVNIARKIWSEKYELNKEINELKKIFYILYNELPKGCLANNINWLKKKINEKINQKINDNINDNVNSKYKLFKYIKILKINIIYKMVLYHYEDIIKISNSDLSELDINVENFLIKYIKIEKDDKYEPVFSQTSKYKSFPVSGNISKKNFLNNNEWKKKNEPLKMELKLSFNKLSLTNYETIKNDIINLLKKKENNIKYFMNELFDKIFFDEQISEMYMNLCSDVWVQKDLIIKIIKIKKNKSKFYYIYNNIKSKEFSNESELIEYAYKLEIFKDFIIEEFNKEFHKRSIYIQNIKNTSDEDKIFFFKKKIFGTIEFIGLLHKHNHIPDKYICSIIDELIKNNNLIELDSFIKLWKIIDKEKFKEYNEKINKIIEEIDDERIICLLKTFSEEKIKPSINDINYINKELIDFKKNYKIEITVNKLNNINKDVLLNELINNIADSFTTKMCELTLYIYKDKEFINKKIDEIEIDDIDMPFANKNIDLFKNYLENI